MRNARGGLEIDRLLDQQLLTELDGGERVDDLPCRVAIAVRIGHNPNGSSRQRVRWLHPGHAIPLHFSQLNLLSVKLFAMYVC